MNGRKCHGTWCVGQIIKFSQIVPLNKIQKETGGFTLNDENIFHRRGHINVTRSNAEEDIIRYTTSFSEMNGSKYE